ncbi:MAG: hypothetical protein R2788_06360 [Saprospiraceae bacterium]
MTRTNGLVPEAVDLLNEIRQRARVTSFDLANFSNADDLVNAILHRRRLSWPLKVCIDLICYGLAVPSKIRMCQRIVLLGPFPNMKLSCRVG